MRAIVHHWGGSVPSSPVTLAWSDRSPPAHITDDGPLYRWTYVDNVGVLGVERARVEERLEELAQRLQQRIVRQVCPQSCGREDERGREDEDGQPHCH